MTKNLRKYFTLCLSAALILISPGLASYQVLAAELEAAPAETGASSLPENAALPLSAAQINLDAGESAALPKSPETPSIPQAEETALPAPAAESARSAKTPVRIAIVGAGPAGFFTAEALLKQTKVPVRVDVFDRLPTPYGLVRSGVAPDHQKAKESTSLYERIAAHPAFRFFGNIRVGKEISAADLARLYDQVVYASGSEAEKKLGIPGEDLRGVHGVSSFVGWYNSHPDHQGRTFDLSGRSAVVIGAGPVALDAARVLAKNPESLSATDISEKALAALKKSGVKSVHVLGRRGPADATFSRADVGELGSLDSADLVVKPEEAPEGDLESANARYLADQARRGEGTAEKKIRLRFFATPLEIMGDGGRVTGVKIKKADGTIEIVPADLVLRAIGYRGAPLPGVPFDQARGVIPNAAGRVLDAAGAWVPGTYVAGWAKHGARGLIGAQRLDAQATAKAMLEDAAAGRFTSPLAKSARAVVDLLEARNARFITIEDWRRIDAMEKAAGAAAGKPRVKFESTAAALEALKSSPEAALPATPRSIQGPIYAEENGALRPLSYNPALPTVPLWKEAWRWIAHFPAKIRAVRSYMARVREHLEEITDDDLRWSLNRFRLLENQEGILRQGNRDLVNNWKQWTGSSLRNVGPDDFNGASLSRTSLRKIFKQAMDREEPTRAYQYTAAMNLHNYMPRVSHFMGVSMQERVIAVALRGRAPARSVWAMEEERHGNIIETVYNLSREPGQPELREQGIAPTSPKPGEYSARSMIANRALAEIGAASGYLLLKSNARKGSPADLALEGIFRDEVYHYALMDAARKWGLGLRTRWARLRNIIRHNFDNPLPEAVDAVIHERSGFSPLTVFQVIYAFYHVDKRVDRFLRTVPDEEGRSLVGKVYQNEGEVRSAIARGEHTWTDPFPMELNPEMSAADVRELARRFPDRFDTNQRRMTQGQIREILDRYRRSLETPSYWLRRKGFQEISAPGTNIARLKRSIGAGAESIRFDIFFPKSGVAWPGGAAVKPFITIRTGEKAHGVLYAGPLHDLSLRQVGLIFSAENASLLAEFKKLGTDYTPKEIADRLLESPVYQAEPIPVADASGSSRDAGQSPARAESDQDKASRSDESAKEAKAYKTYMCLVCGYKYNEKDGDPDQGVKPGTRWEDVPETWTCPECGESKASFEEDMVEIPSE